MLAADDATRDSGIGVKMMEIKAAIDCTGHADLANAVLTCGAQVVFD